MSRTAARWLLRLLARRDRKGAANVVRPLAVAARQKRNSARAAVVVFPVAVVFLHFAVLFAMDVAWPRLRDPEYGRREVQLRARVAEHPSRPLVLVFGSSRAAMGVRPSAWEDTRPGTPRDPLLFNASAVGGGPVVELLMLRRVHDDGFRPSAVLLEYWPPLLRQDGAYADLARRDPRRLQWRDRPTLRAYSPEPDVAERWMRTSRINVVRNNATGLVSQIDSRLLPRPWTHDGSFAALDRWGWLPGMDPHPDDAATRRTLTDRQWEHFGPQMRTAALHPDSDRALREAVATARAHGARVGFLVLPETREFQSHYPPELERAAREHLARLSGELAVPVIDARDWMDERFLADGFHLSRVGATHFTARLGSAVARTFPLGEAP